MFNHKVQSRSPELGNPGAGRDFAPERLLKNGVSGSPQQTHAGRVCFVFCLLLLSFLSFFLSCVFLCFAVLPWCVCVFCGDTPPPQGTY